MLGIFHETVWSNFKEYPLSGRTLLSRFYMPYNTKKTSCLVEMTSWLLLSFVFKEQRRDNIYVCELIIEPTWPHVVTSSNRWVLSNCISRGIWSPFWSFMTKFTEPVEYPQLILSRLVDHVTLTTIGWRTIGNNIMEQWISNSRYLRGGDASPPLYLLAWCQHPPKVCVNKKYFTW